MPIQQLADQAFNVFRENVIVELEDNAFFPNYSNSDDSANQHTQIDIELIDKNRQVISHVLGCSDFVQRVCQQYCREFLPHLPSLLSHSALDQQKNNQLSPASLLTLDSYNFEDLRLSLKNQLLECSNETEAFKIVRQFRHIHMAKIAWHDFTFAQSIQTSLLACSHLANILINESYHYIFEQMSSRYGYPEQKQALLIMGMGKLGGNELNFSSDIDLIFAYPSSGVCDGKRAIEHQVFFTRLAQQLIKMLDQVTQHGRVFRVDMRLRPMGESGPLVLPFSAFENYYQEQGRPWERFAMQKMRIINQTPWNDELNAIITPFVYRKYIDFTTIDAIREMKSLIEKEVRRRQISNNIKLGKGGIREVEFFVQSFQLIHAGRQPQCQIQSILNAMSALEDTGLLPSDDRAQIEADYLFLRKIEHYLQAFNDEQTQTLPNDEINQQRLTLLLKEDLKKAAVDIDSTHNTLTFESLVEACTKRINLIFKSLVKDANQSDESSTSKASTNVFEDVWQLNMDNAELHEACNELLDEASINLLWDMLVQFHKKIERSGVSSRAIQSVNKLMPLLLEEFDIREQQLSSAQVKGVFGILQTISGRATYIDLLLEHPEVRKRLNKLCKKSVWISQQISQYPLLLDELLHPLYLVEDNLTLSEWKNDCADNLRQALLRVDMSDVEAVMDNLRAFKHVNQLRIAAADISATLLINQVSDRLSILAEVIMAQVIEFAWQQIAEIYGQPNGNNLNDKNLALIAYGKFGGIELSYDSDLDLVFLHGADLAQNTDETGTRKQISNQEFYIKLVQKICHLCSTKTYNGILYEIDLRLRPSGNSGLMVSHIESFYDYQNDKAWTWEHQALVRSRLVYGSKTLKQRFDAIRSEILGKTRNIEVLRQEVFDMRIKMREHLHKPISNKIDLKQSPGGIVDIEFMVQYWVLAAAVKHPQLRLWSDNLRLLDSLLEQNIIDESQKNIISDAYLLIRHAAHRLQLANKKHARKGNKLEQAMLKVTDIFTEVFKVNG